MIMCTYYMKLLMAISNYLSLQRDHLFIISRLICTPEKNIYLLVQTCYQKYIFLSTFSTQTWKYLLIAICTYLEYIYFNIIISTYLPAPSRHAPWHRPGLRRLPRLLEGDELLAGNHVPRCWVRGAALSGEHALSEGALGGGGRFLNLSIIYLFIFFIMAGSCFVGDAVICCYFSGMSWFSCICMGVRLWWESTFETFVAVVN